MKPYTPIKTRFLKCFGLWMSVYIIILAIFFLSGCDESLRCSYCGDRVFSGWQIKEFWLCDRCRTYLDDEAEEIWGNEYNIMRRQWMYNKVLEKNK